MSSVPKRYRRTEGPSHQRSITALCTMCIER